MIHTTFANPTSLSVFIAISDSKYANDLLLTLSNNDFLIKKTSSKSDDFILKIQQNNPDFLILDENDGFEIIKKLKSINKTSTKCIILLESPNNFFLTNAFFTDANAYLAKNEDPMEIIFCIDKLLEGERYLSSSIANKIFNSTLSKEYKDLLKKLTKKEQEIVRYFGLGYSIKAIAQLLYISEHTVTTHKSNIILKLNLISSKNLRILASKIVNSSVV